MRKPRKRYGKTELRLAFVILLTGVLPLAASLWLANSLFSQASQVWFNPDVGTELDHGISLYQEYAKARKEDLRHQAEAIAHNEVLVRAACDATNDHRDTIKLELQKALDTHSSLVAVRYLSAGMAGVGTDAVDAIRGGAKDATKENEFRRLNVQEAIPGCGEQHALSMDFEVPSDVLKQREASARFVDGYHRLERSRDELYSGPLKAFGFLLGATVIATITLGILLARGVTRRIRRLSDALATVATGDLRVRVPVTGDDEFTELAAAFNHMTRELSDSRARVEFLGRVAAWQEMAKRLAHEIKNPLTPILLSVEEAERRYAGDDVAYRQLLLTTREVVTEEVSTLRRLVTDFSNFARMPEAKLEQEDLCALLAECSDVVPAADEPHVVWRIPNHAITCLLDRQMFRRVVANLLENARAAAKGQARTPSIVVSVQARDEIAEVHVEDAGPGVDAAIGERVFEPYVTTKSEGTGLGLAIVKKIVIEHGGTIELSRSIELGGADFCVRLPTASARAPYKMM